MTVCCRAVNVHRFRVSAERQLPDHRIFPLVVTLDITVALKGILGLEEGRSKVES